MNNEKKNANSSKDELIKTNKNNIELTESELGRVSGGFDIKGESVDSKHKDEIHIEI